MIHFVHTADIHLDSPMRGLVEDDITPTDEIRKATRGTVIKLVDLCIDQRVPLLIISGDLYDGDWKDFSTGLFFVSQMQRLADHNIRVAVVRGNHDAANKMTRTLVLPENVKVFSSKKAETWILEDLGLAIHGQSYAKQAVTENLVPSYPAPVEGYTNIGILHCLLSGAEGHQPYAPCSLDDLQKKQYQYWALGHVHSHELVSQHPPVVYPGCLQGRNIRETGPKGCVIVTGESGEELSTQFQSLDLIRWYHVQVDINGIENFAGILKKLEEELQQLEQETELFLCLRLTFTGMSPLHGELLADPEQLRANCQATVIQTLGTRVMIQKVSLQTHSNMNIDALGKSDTPQGELIRFMAGLDDSSFLEELEIDFSQLKTKLVPSGLIPEPEPALLNNSRDLLLQELTTLQVDEK